MEPGTEKLTEQYEALPTQGMSRFWIGIESWLEDWPEDAPFFFWQTGTGCDNRMRPSMMGSEEAKGLPPVVIGFSTKIPSEVMDRVYVANGMLTMLVDAPDKATALEIVRTHFPDMVERFVSAADCKTLSSLGRGRFEHPSGNAPDQGAPAP